MIRGKGEGGGTKETGRREDFSRAAWDFQEQWPHWWWQTSCNTILDHMPSENYPLRPLIAIRSESFCVHIYTHGTTLRPITKRNNIIEQQKRPWPETLRLDTNVQICRVIELHNGSEALGGWRGKNGFSPIEFLYFRLWWFLSDGDILKIACADSMKLRHEKKESV